MGEYFNCARCGCGDMKPYGKMFICDSCGYSECEE